MNVIKNGVDFHGEITTIVKDIIVLNYDYCHQVICQKSMVHRKGSRKVAREQGSCNLINVVCTSPIESKKSLCLFVSLHAPFLSAIVCTLQIP